MTARLMVLLVSITLLSQAARADSKKPKASEPAPAAAVPLPLLVPAAPTPPLPIKTPTNFQIGIYRLVPPGADDAGMEAIDAVFTDVAQASKRYRSVVKLQKPPKLCALEDDNCFALLGGFQQLDQILVGEVIKLQNGAAVKVRLIDVAKGKAIGQKALTVASEDRKEIKVWAEALACELLNGAVCYGQALLDTDLPEMKIYIDNQPAQRTGKQLEQMRLPLGVHAVRVTVDQRTSLERKLLVSRDQPTRPSLYARQLSEGGISLLPSQDLQLDVSGKPNLPPSAKVVNRGVKWTTPTGLALGAAALVTGGFGTYELLHGRNQIKQADNAAGARGGAYTQAELGGLSSAQTNQKIGGVLLVTAAVLAVAGVALTFAF